jgi:Flp pilus assembly protein TadG
LRPQTITGRIDISWADYTGSLSEAGITAAGFNRCSVGFAMIAAYRKLRAGLRRFTLNSAGNVALTFGIATFPILGAVGAAVDFSRANDVKSAMQSALDATALMLSRDAATLSTDDLNTKAKNYFLAMFVRPEATNVTVTASYSQSGGSQVIVNGAAKVPTAIMGIVGYNSININGSSTAKWCSERLRGALALDNTGSMSSDGKMDALKSATKSLLLQLKGAASTNGDVYVSIIPFSKDVNVGKTNYNASWIDWTDWNTNNTSCGSSWGWGGGWSWGGGCTTANHNTWNGCITDRGGTNSPDSNDYDRKVTAPGTTAASKFPTEQYSLCPVEMQGLTYDWTTLNSLVDSMSPNGNTNQPIGLVWAWQSLVGGGPLTAPAKDSNYTYKEIIILMSDGLNTEDRWWQSQNSVDKRMYDSSNSGVGTCANIKAAGVTIYSIQVNTGGDPTSTIMTNCASSSDKFYEVKVAGDLGTVFNAIGTNLTKLRVAK